MRSFGVGLRLASLLVMTALFMAKALPSAAQAPDEIDSLFEQVAAVDAKGRHAEALVNARRLLAAAEAKYGAGSQEVGTYVNVIAVLLHGGGQFADAERFYRRSLAIRERALGPHHLDVGSSLENLGRLYLDQGRAAEAEWFYLQALSIIERALGQDDPAALATREALGRVRLAKANAVVVEIAAPGLRTAGAPARGEIPSTVDVVSVIPTLAVPPATGPVRSPGVKASAGVKPQTKARASRAGAEAANWSETAFAR